MSGGLLPEPTTFASRHLTGLTIAELHDLMYLLGKLQRATPRVATPAPSPCAALARAHEGMAGGPSPDGAGRRDAPPAHGR